MFFESDISGKNILLHACCGPCSLGAIDPLLEQGGLVTLFYYNPCIIVGEFDKRLDALRTVAEHYSLDIVVPPHDRKAFTSYAAPHALEQEGGERCSLCMGDRLRATAEYAKAHGYDMFTTTLTVSPHKNSKLIFSLADNISDELGVPFLPKDFKKRDGFMRSCRLSAELGIYRQSFCGCEYSYRPEVQAPASAVCGGEAK